ncbi:MAG: regulatory iron-sulfur-containing complex subunit RicT [Anaerolineaceae bacterium]
MSTNRVISVQFNKLGKSYHFSVPETVEVTKDNFVVVSTNHGRQVGRVVNAEVTKPNNSNEILPIERVANDEDMAIREVLNQKEAEALDIVVKFLRESHFQNVKAVSTEYGFESNRLTIFLNYDNDSNFDIKAFLRDISRNFRDSRIEVRQVGPRDMAKAISGFGACGIEKRCCSRFLTEFSSISIKMAKSQDISLTPGEITGICSRLRCCLIYEHEAYEAARANLPKRKKVVQTPFGEGKVIQVLPMADSVVVDIPERGPTTFTRVELETGVMEEAKVKPVVDLDPHQFADDVELVRLATSPKLPNQSPTQSRRDGQLRQGRREQREGDRRPSVDRSNTPHNPNTQGRPQGNRPRPSDQAVTPGQTSAPRIDRPRRSERPNHAAQPTTDQVDENQSIEKPRGNFRRRRR